MHRPCSFHILLSFLLISFASPVLAQRHEPMGWLVCKVKTADDMPCANVLVAIAGEMWESVLTGDNGSVRGRQHAGNYTITVLGATVKATITPDTDTTVEVKLSRNQTAFCANHRGVGINTRQFYIVMPGGTTEQPIDEKADLGPVKDVKYKADVGDASIVLAFSDLSAKQMKTSSPETIIDDAVKAWTEASSAKYMKESKVEVKLSKTPEIPPSTAKKGKKKKKEEIEKNASGVDIEATLPGNIAAQVRIILATNRMYTLAYLHPRTESKSLEFYRSAVQSLVLKGRDVQVAEQVAEDKKARELSATRKKLEKAIAGDDAACKKGDGKRCLLVAQFNAANIGPLENPDIAGYRRKACELGNADGCYWVARAAFVASALADENRAPAVAALAEATKTACDAGMKSACHDATRSKALESLSAESGSDVADALKTLDGECTAGDKPSCVYAANYRLIEAGHVDGLKQREALAGMCDSFGVEGCQLAANALRLWGEGDDGYKRSFNEAHRKGCKLGDAFLCIDFARSQQLFPWPYPANSAREALKLTCEAGDFYSCTQLGAILLEGITGNDGARIRMDRNGALAYLRAGCWANDGRACDWVVRLEDNPKKSFEAYARVCSIGTLEDCRGGTNGGGGPSDASVVVPLYIRFFENRCTSKNATACYVLGLLFGSAFNGAENQAKKVEFFTRGCEYGVAYACDDVPSSGKDHAQWQSTTQRACDLDGKMRPGCN